MTNDEGPSSAREHHTVSAGQGAILDSRLTRSDFGLRHYFGFRHSGFVISSSDDKSIAKIDDAISITRVFL